MESQAAQVIDVVEYHLVPKSSDGNSQSSVCMQETRLKQGLILRQDRKEQNQKRISGVAPIGHVVMPTLRLVIYPFAEHHRRLENGMEVVVQIVRVSAQYEDMS